MGLNLVMPLSTCDIIMESVLSSFFSWRVDDYRTQGRRDLFSCEQPSVIEIPLGGWFPGRNFGLIDSGSLESL
ncbi:hypothetical protein V6N13_129632 [Hibiscus sabdariffa]